VEGKQAESTT